MEKKQNTSDEAEFCCLEYLETILAGRICCSYHVLQDFCLIFIMTSAH